MFSKFACGLLLIVVLIVEGNCSKFSKGDVPRFFLRRLRNSNAPVHCDKVRMRSQPANISLTRMDKQLAYNIKLKMNSSGHSFEKMELRLEITGNFKPKVKKLLKRKYLADMRLVGTPGDRYNQTILPTYGEDRFIELTLDITSIARNTRPDSPTDLNFDFIIKLSNGRTMLSLMRTDTKAFVIHYERVASCNFMDALGHGIDFQKSPEILWGLGDNRNNLKSLTRAKTTKLCRVKSFRVNFVDLGFKAIVAPNDLNVGICDGFCTSKTMKNGYAFLKNAYSKRYNQGQPSSCRPSEYGGTNMIYVDSSDGGFVMTYFSGMFVKKCDCY